MLRFGSFNPIALIIYFLSVLTVSMFSQNFILLLISLSGAIFYSVISKGFIKFLKSFFGYVIIFLLVIITNPIFSHNGVTPLIFVNDIPITLEAIVYGVIIGLMLLSAIMWFSVLNYIFDSEKLMFIFGKTFPKLALLFSMTLHFVPQFITSFRKILAAQASFEHQNRLKRYIDAFSSCVTVSLEDSVEISNSMNSRGYGLQKRSFYSQFRFTVSDALLLSATLALFGFTAFSIFSGRLDFAIYPAVIMPGTDFLSVSAYFAFGLLSFLPFIIEAREELIWKFCASKI